MRNPRFDPDEILIGDQRSPQEQGKINRGNDAVRRYNFAADLYWDRHRNDPHDQTIIDWYKSRMADEIAAREAAQKSRMENGAFPGISSAGRHRKLRQDIINSILGLM